jgi:ketosteroid isomerase-like protein
MSEENVEQVREAWKASIERGVDGLLDLYAEDCVCEDFPDMPDRATYEGRDGVRKRDEHFSRIWGDLLIEPVELIDAGGDRVVGVVNIQARGRGSGAPIDDPSAFLYEFRDGNVARDRAFRSKAEALEAAGLRE